MCPDVNIWKSALIYMYVLLAVKYEIQCELYLCVY
jgi:hypothetical protein